MASRATKILNGNEVSNIKKSIRVYEDLYNVSGSTISQREVDSIKLIKHYRDLKK